VRPRCGVPDIFNGSTVVAGKRQGDQERYREIERETGRSRERKREER
jgi:hypothetical protein